MQYKCHAGSTSHHADSDMAATSGNLEGLLAVWLGEDVQPGLQVMGLDNVDYEEK